MINASAAAKTVLEQDTTLVINSGCTVEYNMNNLVDNIVMTGADITRTDSAGNSYLPFKKLFPIDAVVKPSRPLGAGIKYAIVGDIAQNSYRDPRVSQYPVEYRTYYPGAETSYKYYLSDKGVGLDVTATYPKTILTNKIVVRFELAHSTPATWTIYNGVTQIATGTSSSIKPFETSGNKNYDAGTLILYYNGTSWSTTEPSSPASPVNMTSLRVTTGAVTGKYIGLIEMSPRWVIDISDRLIDFSISKEASSDSSDILPVGNVSANSMAMSVVSFEDSRSVISFDKTMDFNSQKVYLYKRIEFSPYFKIYHSAGTLSDSTGNYEKINQGVFYADNWSIGEYGEISITALDGAKILQETIAPSLVCKGYTTIGIIRNLLDSIGFTNYNFNTTASDQSIFSARFWWTDDGRTVWESVQQLCRDSQMVALFDENNVLQFYTREYIFNSSDPIDWSFRYSTDESNLPNILSFDKQDLSSANQVKVIWNSVTTNQYVGNSQPLWKSNNTFMGALSLEQNLLSTDTTGDYISLKAVVTNEYQQGQILNEYSGYLAIDSEIIEYDAIQYDYIDETGTTQYVDIKNESDALKYLGLAEPGSKNYQPNGKYRIKTRGAFDTQIANHYANAQGIIDSWNGYEVKWV
jgi:hypothetical protein